jgi:hypothetical protein
VSQIDDLQAQLNTLRQGLHQLIVARQFALNTDQQVAADQLEVQIQNVGQQYNVIVGKLRDLEGPSSALVMLDKVGDTVIEGVKTGATATLTAAGQVVSAVGNTAAGLGTLAKVLPWAVLALLVVLGIGLYRGSLKANLAVPGTS